MNASMKSLALAATLALGTVSLAQATDYPTKSIDVIVPYGAGQATDVMCRAFLEQLRQELGQTIVPVNRPGAGGNIGGAEAARSEPDGYTLLCTGNATHLGNPLMYDNMGFDPFEDLVPINMIAGTGFVLLANEKYEGKTVQEIVEEAKASGEAPTLGVVSTTAQVVYGELVDATGVEFVRVPYSAGNQAMFADLISGEIDLAIEAMPSSVGQVQGGRIKALAVTTPEESPFFPGVPTFHDLGYDIELVGWNAFYAPAGTPEAVLAKLNTAANQALTAPDVAKTLAGVASLPLGGSPDDLRQKIAADGEKWERTIRNLGLKAN